VAELFDRLSFSMYFSHRYSYRYQYSSCDYDHYDEGYDGYAS